jgi:hypothetical protein
MKKKLKIEVTEGDIKRGDACSAGSCPVAKAVRRATNWKKTVAVKGGQIEVDGVAYRAPAPVTYFVGRFDDELPVKPFSFELELR